MTDHERKSGAINSTTHWPYHSETHDLVLREMTSHGGEVPLSKHERQREAECAAAERHERAAAYSAESYDTEDIELQLAQANEAVKNLTWELLAKHQALNIARDALALQLSRETDTAADDCTEADIAV